MNDNKHSFITAVFSKNSSQNLFYVQLILSVNAQSMLVKTFASMSLMPRAPVHVDYVQEIRSINVLPRFSIDHGGRVDHINEYLDRLIRRMCYELRGTKDSHYDVSQSWN